MKREDLIKYKQKISSLSEEEKRIRDKHLKDLANGTLQGPPVGYQSIDKPWLKFQDLNNDLDFPKKTLYQGIYDNNANNLNDLAIEFFLAKITYKKLFQNVDETSKSLVTNGIKKGDFVTICAPGIPETVYAFYALSKIGAVANMMAPYFDKEDLIKRIKDCNSELLIVMDSFYDEIKSSIQKSNIKKIIVVPTLNSSPLKIFSKKYKLENDKEVYWNQFIDEGKKEKDISPVEYETNMPLSMVYSSGTTGASKGILLSNDSFINSIKSYFKSGLDISKGQKFYQIIPTWYSTGISTSVALPHYCGASVYMDPRFERKVFIRNIIKAKPNYSVAPTSMYEGLLDNAMLKNKDLSYFKYPFEGGEPLSRELSERINKVLREHGNDSSIKVGYGQCECGATVTTQTDNTENSNGSVGIPLPDINIQICDQNYNEVLTGNRGQILVDTSSGMVEYYKNEISTSEYFFIDESNIKWNCTGDIGYVDKNGNLYVEGRASDYSIVNGEMIYNFDIEKMIKNVPGIKLCDVLDKNGNTENQLIVHIILDDKYDISQDQVINNIQSTIYEMTNDVNMVPLIFKFRNEFPYAKSGKRDVITMKTETDGFKLVDYNINMRTHSK